MVPVTMRWKFLSWLLWKAVQHEKRAICEEGDTSTQARTSQLLLHVDGYDRLKPYGFPIHSAIDGFSRRILWLHVTRSMWYFKNNVWHICL